MFGVLSYNEFKDAWEILNPLALFTHLMSFTRNSAVEAMIKHYKSVIKHELFGCVVYSCIFAVSFYYANLLFLKVYRKHARQVFNWIKSFFTSVKKDGLALFKKEPATFKKLEINSFECSECNNARNIVFMPCQHCYLCETCHNVDNKSCGKCNTEVSSVIKLFVTHI